jgi:hypothetical protein
MRRTAMKNVALVLTLALLAGAALETALARPKRQDAEPFHARVRQAAQALAMSFGEWEGQDAKVHSSAVALLRPNVVVQRRFTHRRSGQEFTFLLVQCRDAADMGGHYPPICYPSQGWETGLARSGEWRVPGDGGRPDRVIRGMEYEYWRMEHGTPRTYVVRNLIILPQGRYARDIKEVREAAGDYLRQFYGAAQVQVMFAASRFPTEGERDRVFAELMGQCGGVLDALTSGGVR